VPVAVVWRIVLTYDMWVDERHMSTSVTTITLADHRGNLRVGRRLCHGAADG
jgi:hypothetical protein